MVSVECLTDLPCSPPELLDIKLPVSLCHGAGQQADGNSHCPEKPNGRLSTYSDKDQAGPGEHCAALRGVGARLLCAVLRAAQSHESLLPEGGSVSDAGWLQLAAWLAVEQVDAQPCCLCS